MLRIETASSAGSARQRRRASQSPPGSAAGGGLNSRAPRSYLAKTSAGSVSGGGAFRRSSRMVVLPTEPNTIRCLASPLGQSSRSSGVSLSKELTVFCGTKFGCVKPYNALTGQPSTSAGGPVHGGGSSSGSPLPGERDCLHAVIRRVPGEATVCPTALLQIDDDGGGVQMLWVAYADGSLRVYSSCAVHIADTLTSSSSSSGSENSFQLVSEHRKHNGKITALCCSNKCDGNGSRGLQHYVFSTGHDWAVVRWRADSGECDGVVGKHSLAGRCLMCLRSRAYLASGGDDGLVKLWPMHHLERPHVLDGHTAAVVAMLEVEGKLWSGSEDGTIILWGIVGSTQGKLQQLTGHRTHIVALHQVDRLVYSCDKNAAVLVWNIDTATLLHAFVAGDDMPIGLHQHYQRQQQDTKKNSSINSIKTRRDSPTNRSNSPETAATASSVARPASPSTPVAKSKRSASGLADSTSRRTGGTRAATSNSVATAGGPCYITGANIVACVKGVLCCFVTTEGTKWTLLPDQPVAEALEAAREEAEVDTSVAAAVASEVEALQRKLEEVEERELRQHDVLEQLNADMEDAAAFFTNVSSHFLSLVEDMSADHAHRLDAMLGTSATRLASRTRISAQQALEEKLKHALSAKSELESEVKDAVFAKNQLQLELTAKKEEATKIRVHLTKHQMDSKKATEELEALSSKHRDMSHELELVKQKMNHERSEAKRQQAAAEAEARQLQSRIAAMDEENQKLRQRHASLDTELFTATTTCSDITFELDQTRSKLAAALSQLKEREADHRNPSPTLRVSNRLTQTDELSFLAQSASPQKVRPTPEATEERVVKQQSVASSIYELVSFACQGSELPSPSLSKWIATHLANPQASMQQMIAAVLDPADDRQLVVDVSACQQVLLVLLQAQAMSLSPQSSSSSQPQELGRSSIAMEAELDALRNTIVGLKAATSKDQDGGSGGVIGMMKVELAEVSDSSRLRLEEAEERLLATQRLLKIISAGTLGQLMTTMSTPVAVKPAILVTPRDAHEALRHTSADDIMAMTVDDACFQAMLRGVVASSPNRDQHHRHSVDGDDDDGEDEADSWKTRSSPIGGVMRAIQGHTRRLTQLAATGAIGFPTEIHVSDALSPPNKFLAGSKLEQGALEEIRRIHDALTHPWQQQGMHSAQPSPAPRRTGNAVLSEAAPAGQHPLLEVARGHLFSMRSPSR